MKQPVANRRTDDLIAQKKVFCKGLRRPGAGMTRKEGQRPFNLQHISNTPPGSEVFLYGISLYLLPLFLCGKGGASTV